MAQTPEARPSKRDCAPFPSLAQQPGGWPGVQDSVSSLVKWRKALFLSGLPCGRNESSDYKACQMEPLLGKGACSL